jgi:hypothetical protein
MSQRYSSRYRNRDKRPQHVRRPNNQSLPTWMIALAAIAGLIALGVLAQFIINAVGGDDTTEQAQSNRLWLDQRWTTETRSNAEWASLLQRIEDNRIETIYVETGAWRQDGTYREWAEAAAFRERMDEAASDVDVLLWIWYEPATHANDVSQTALRTYATQAIETWGYDGLHLQGYTILNESQNYLDFVTGLNEALGNRTLSITAPPDHSPADVDVPRGTGNPDLSWSPGYKGQMAALVDEMVIMAHASGLEARDDYERWVAYQVETYARDLDRTDNDAALIVALPAYPRELFHDPQTETVTAAANGAREGIRNAENAGRYVVGAGVYLYDTATTADWDAFGGFWLDD